jgi:hypothetical protein
VLESLPERRVLRRFGTRRGFGGSSKPGLKPARQDLRADGSAKGNVKWSREKFKLEKAGKGWNKLDGRY